MTKGNKLINTLIATSVALIVIASGLSAWYKYANPKKSFACMKLALTNTLCLGALVWMKDKSKQK